MLSGELTIQLRDRDVELGPGELFVVPRGVEHCPRSDDGAEILLIEPAGTVNTGDAPPGPLTRGASATSSAHIVFTASVQGAVTGAPDTARR